MHPSLKLITKGKRVLNNKMMLDRFRCVSVAMRADHDHFDMAIKAVQ